MRQTKKFAVIKDNKIIATFHTADGIDGVKKSIGNVSYDSIEETPVELYDVKQGMDRREFDKGFWLKKLSERVRDGHIEVPHGNKLHEETIIPMTLQEKAQSGLVELPARHKAIGNDIIPMTDPEIVASKQATQKQLDDERKAAADEILIQEEIMKIAIERLTAAGKLSK